MMNIIETKAYNWLISKGDKKEDIVTRSNKSPDFILKDGRTFEVKKLYGNNVLFYSKQIEELSDDTSILVFSDKSDDEPFKQWRWGDIKDKDKIDGLNIRKVTGKEPIKKFFGETNSKNRLMGEVEKIALFLSTNPGKSKHQIADKTGMDTRTVANVIECMKTLDSIEENKISVGKNTYTNYNLKRRSEKMVQTLKKNAVLDFLDAVVNEKEGYRLGSIWRHTDKSLGGVLPILKGDGDKDERIYAMMEELKDKDAIQITDTGSINKIKIKSDSKKPIFIRMGTSFEGDSQTRAADTSVIIMPHVTEQEISVKCVYASKGIVEGASFNVAGATPQCLDRAFVSGAGQSQVWNKVSKYASSQMQAMSFKSGGDMRLCSLGPSDDLMGNVEKVKEYKKKSKNILKNIPCLENQVGCIIFDQKGVLSLELFDHPNSWIAFHESIYEKYEDILSDEHQGSLFELKKNMIPKLVAAFVEDMKSAEMEQLKAEEKGKYNYVTYGLKNTALGEVTTLNGEIIHILGLRKENGDEKEPTTTSMPGLTLAELNSGYNRGEDMHPPHMRPAPHTRW